MNDANRTEIKAPQEAILDLPQERITGDILRGRGPRRGNLERLIKYWRPIMRKPGGFRRCLVILADHPELYPLERICAWLHHETTGLWPNEGNHHAGGKLGPIKRNVSRARFPKVRGRKKKGIYSDFVEVGVEIPLRRADLRMADEKSVTFAPLDGTPEQLEWKAAGRRVERTIQSILLPGEVGATKPRHLLRTSLTPGGSGAPGPKLSVGRAARSRLGVRGGSATERGFRCPSGFQHGGKFTDATYSTCGRQLFRVPGAGIAGPRSIVSSGPNRRQATGTAIQSANVPDTPPRTQGRPVLPKPLGRPDLNAQNASLEKAIKDAAATKSARIVRSDGTVIEPIVPIELLSQQEDNPDLVNSIYVANVDGLKPFGASELELMKTGLKSIQFALPGGGTASITRNSNDKMPPGEARSFGKALTAAQKLNLPDTDMAGILREVAKSTDAATFDISIPGLREDLNRTVRVEREGSSRSVPLWVYRTFLSRDAAGRPPGVKPYTLINGQKNMERAVMRWKTRQATSAQQWGPLEYTAQPIPHVGDEDYHNAMKFKASQWRNLQAEASFVYQETKARAVWDIGIDRFRCPPGTSNAGQITNRFGLGCGAAVVRRAVSAVRRVGRTAQDLSDGDIIDSGVRRPRVPAQRGSARQAAVLERMADAIDPDTSRRRNRNRSEDRRGALLDRMADAIDPDTPRRQRQVDAPGPSPETPEGRQDDDRRESLLRRMANFIDPEPLRTERPFRDRRYKFAEAMPERDGLNSVLASDLDVQSEDIRDRWESRMGIPGGEFDLQQARDFLREAQDDMNPSEYERLTDELIDYQLMQEMLEDGDLGTLPAAVDQLTDTRWNSLLDRLRREDANVSRLERAEQVARSFRRVHERRDRRISTILSESQREQDGIRASLRGEELGELSPIEYRDLEANRARWQQIADRNNTEALSFRASAGRQEDSVAREEALASALTLEARRDTALQNVSLYDAAINSDGYRERREAVFNPQPETPEVNESAPDFNIFQARNQDLPTPPEPPEGGYFDARELNEQQRERVLVGVREYRGIVYDFWGSRLGSGSSWGYEDVDAYVERELRDPGIHPGYRNTLIRRREDYAMFEFIGNDEEDLVNMPNVMGERRGRGLLTAAGVRSSRSRRQSARSEPTVTATPGVGIGDPTQIPQVDVNTERPWSPPPVIAGTIPDLSESTAAARVRAGETFRGTTPQAVVGSRLDGLEHKINRFRQGAYDNPDEMLVELNQTNDIINLALIQSANQVGINVDGVDVGDLRQNIINEIADNDLASESVLQVLNRYDALNNQAREAMRERGINYQDGPIAAALTNARRTASLDGALVSARSARRDARRAAERDARDARRNARSERARAAAAQQSVGLANQTHFRAVAFGSDDKELFKAAESGDRIELGEGFGAMLPQPDGTDLPENTWGEMPNPPVPGLQVKWSRSTGVNMAGTIRYEFRNPADGSSGFVGLNLSRHIEEDNTFKGRLAVYAAIMELDDPLQASGVANDLQQRLIATMGGGESVAEATTAANITIGVYSWARSGFDFKDGRTPSWIRANARQIASYLDNPDDTTAKARAGSVIAGALNISSRGSATREQVDEILQSYLDNADEVRDAIRAVSSNNYVEPAQIAAVGKNLDFPRGGVGVKMHPGRVFFLGHSAGENAEYQNTQRLRVTTTRPLTQGWRGIMRMPDPRSEEAIEAARVRPT